MNCLKGSPVTKRWFVAMLLGMVAGGALAVTTCRFSTGIPGMGFGTYDLLSTLPNDTQLRVDVECTRNGGSKNVTVNLGISQGTYGTSVANRRMRNASGDFLNYGLFLDSARSAVWGITNGVDTGALSLVIPNNNTVAGSLLVFGRMPAGQQDVSAGSYSDSIQMLLTP